MLYNDFIDWRALMKIQDAKVGMTVKSIQNPWTPKYLIKTINNNFTVDVEHRDGTMVMKGGKMVPEVFTYEQVDINILEPVND